MYHSNFLRQSCDGGGAAMYRSHEPLATPGFMVNSASGMWLAMNRSEATGSWRRGWDLNPQGPLGPAVFKTARIARFPAPLRANYTRKRRNEDERWLLAFYRQWSDATLA